MEKDFGKLSDGRNTALYTITGGGLTAEVSDFGALLVRLWVPDKDGKLDDVVLEMCKYVTKLEMLQKSVSAEQKDEFMATTFHFYKSEGEDDARILTFMYGFNGQMLGVNIGWNVYQDCAGILERNPQIRPEDGFAQIDATWLASKLA